MVILFVILFVLLMLSAIDFHLTIKKNVIYNNMDLLYVELENYILNNQIKVDENLEKYLYNIKTLKNNKDFTDVQIMIMIMILKSMSQIDFNKKRQAIKKIDKHIPDEILGLGNKFYYEATRATKLSKFTPRFVLFLLVKTTSVLISNLLKRSYKNISNYFNVVRKVFNYTFDIERIIASKETLSAI